MLNPQFLVIKLLWSTKENTIVSDSFLKNIFTWRLLTASQYPYSNVNIESRRRGRKGILVLEKYFIWIEEGKNNLPLSSCQHTPPLREWSSTKIWNLSKSLICSCQQEELTERLLFLHKRDRDCSQNYCSFWNNVSLIILLILILR